MAFTYDPLWKTLIDKNMNKEDLRKLINSSPSTIAKLSKNEYVALRVIDDICKALNVKSISNVIEYVTDELEPSSSNLDDLENLIDEIMSRRGFNKVTPMQDQVRLYQMLMKTIVEHEYIKTAEDAERFSNIYVNCSNNKLLSGDLMSNVNKTIWNIPNQK